MSHEPERPFTPLFALWDGWVGYICGQVLGFITGWVVAWIAYH